MHLSFLRLLREEGEQHIQPVAVVLVYIHISYYSTTYSDSKDKVVIRYLRMGQWDRF